jgi:hypothetical protein
MNDSLKLCFLFFIFCFFIKIPSTYAEQKNENTKMEVKCHITYDNGEEALTFWLIRDNDISKLEHDIIGQGVVPESRLDKLAIIKVHQCVPERGQFREIKSRQLDMKTER